MSMQVHIQISFETTRSELVWTWFDFYQEQEGVNASDKELPPAIWVQLMRAGAGAPTFRVRYFAINLAF